ncbi:hypothetical protein Q8814_05880, partial [Rhodococcus sp. CC-R104]|nr:hypothetical protein [Rhodococcus sp. CC-R104]
MMPFGITKLHERYVCGLVLPDVEPGGIGQKAELMMFTQERIRSRGVRDVVVVYVCHAEIGWSALVGFECDGLSD